MMKLHKLTLIVVMLALFTGACAWLTDFTVEQNQMEGSGSMLPFTVDEEVSVTGVVTGMISDCAFDGICALVLDVNGEEVNAIWAEGMLMCEGAYTDGLEEGALVSAFGVARDANSLSICPSADYYIRPADG